MRDITPSKWTIAGVGVTAAALGAAGMIAVGGDDADPADAGTITLRDQSSVKSLGDPVSVDAPADDVSVSGESLSSPLQSPDDSPAGVDSVDSPGDSPASPASVASPDAAPASVASPASVDSP